jgi:hypothetical protein
VSYGVLAMYFNELRVFRINPQREKIIFLTDKEDHLSGNAKPLQRPE